MAIKSKCEGKSGKLVINIKSVSNSQQQRLLGDMAKIATTKSAMPADKDCNNNISNANNNKGNGSQRRAAAAECSSNCSKGNKQPTSMSTTTIRRAFGPGRVKVPYRLVCGCFV